MSTRNKPHRAGGHKYRKVGRNKRLHNNGLDGKWAVTAPISRYRLRYGIPIGTRKANHAAGLCRVHAIRAGKVIRTITPITQ